MLRWTGGTRSRAEESRRHGKNETFFPPEAFRVPEMTPLEPQRPLADSTNFATRPDLTPKQVQHSVDAQTLRWAVRSPLSSDRQKKKKARLEQPSATHPMDVSPIPLAEDPSLDRPLHFATPSSSSFQLLATSSSPFLDPNEPTMPFYGDSDRVPHEANHSVHQDSDRNSALPLFPSAAAAFGRPPSEAFYAPFEATADFVPMSFQTGRQLLEATPEMEQHQWRCQQQQWHHNWHALQGLQSAPNFAYPPPSPPLEAPNQPSPLHPPHPSFLSHVTLPGPATHLPSTRMWAYPATDFEQRMNFPHAPCDSNHPLFFTPL